MVGWGGCRAANGYIRAAQASAAHVQKVSADGDRRRRNICHEGLSAENIRFQGCGRDGEDGGVRCLLSTAENETKPGCIVGGDARPLSAIRLSLPSKVVVSSLSVAAIWRLMIH